MRIPVDAELNLVKNNIVQNTVVSLFLAFDNELKSNQCRFTIQDKRNILKTFEIVYGDLNYILYYGGKNKFMTECLNGNHPLETLSGMASSCDLKQHLIELKELLEGGLGEIELIISNYQSTKNDTTNDIYLRKYIEDVFKYRLV